MAGSNLIIKNGRDFRRAIYVLSMEQLNASGEARIDISKGILQFTIANEEKIPIAQATFLPSPYIAAETSLHGATVFLSDITNRVEDECCQIGISYGNLDGFLSLTIYDDNDAILKCFEVEYYHLSQKKTIPRLSKGRFVKEVVIPFTSMMHMVEGFSGIYKDGVHSYVHCLINEDIGMIKIGGIEDYPNKNKKVFKWSNYDTLREAFVPGAFALLCWYKDPKTMVLNIFLPKEGQLELLVEDLFHVFHCSTNQFF